MYIECSFPNVFTLKFKWHIKNLEVDEKKKYSANAYYANTVFSRKLIGHKSRKTNNT